MRNSERVCRTETYAAGKSRMPPFGTTGKLREPSYTAYGQAYMAGETTCPGSRRCVQCKNPNIFMVFCRFGLPIAFVSHQWRLHFFLDSFAEI